MIPDSSKFERIVDGRGGRFLLRVETSSDAADYRKYEELRNIVWAFPEDHMAGTRNMMCENFLHEGASLFLGAFAPSASGRFETDGAHLAGFAYGFVGIRDKARGFADPANLWFYAQYAGVRPDYLKCGLGILLKEFQRDVLLDVFGIGTVVCTYDPLTGVNAYRNVRRFGMDVLEYRTATYGEYGGRLNRRDVPSDRFFMSWELRREPRPPLDPAVLLGAPRALAVRAARVEGVSGEILLETPGEPALDSAAPVVLVPIPDDFYVLLRETDVADDAVRRLPLDWRLKTRRIFTTLFGRGYRVVDFFRAPAGTPRNFYVLRRD